MHKEPSKNDLVRKYLWLANYLAHKISLTVPIPKEDLYHEGVIGLIDAASKYDTKKANGATFKTYAYWRVRGAILDSIWKYDWLPNGTRTTDETDIESLKRWALFNLAPQESELPKVEIIDLKEAIRRLREQQRIVMTLYLNGLQFTKIAPKLKVTNDRISQIYAEAVEVLKKRLKFR